jgi:DNA-binding NarL/FixJ family response regulator
VSGRVVLAEDDVLLREGLASLMQRKGYDVIGQAGSGEEAVRLVRRLRPDLVVIDIRMPPGYALEGLEAAAAIRHELPEVAVLVLSAHVEVEHALELLAGGSRVGYLLKSRVTAVDDFLDAVERVAAGGSVVDPTLVQELINERRHEDPLGVLTPRELEVLALMAEGRSNAGIGKLLFVTEGTVEKHVKSILGKLRIPAGADDHRRVLVVVRYLEAR